MSERWLPVTDFEEHYEVSDLGRVRRTKPAPHTRPGYVLKGALDRKGYNRVGLCVAGKHFNRQVHRLVAEAFLGRSDLEVNHVNGIKNDNRLENLEFVTRSQNTIHAFRVLGHPPNRNPNKGGKNGRAILKEADLPEIFRLSAEGWSQQRIADQFGIHQTTVSCVLRKASWAA
jgi:hypothetical protein